MDRNRIARAVLKEQRAKNIARVEEGKNKEVLPPDYVGDPRIPELVRLIRFFQAQNQQKDFQQHIFKLMQILIGIYLDNKGQINRKKFDMEPELIEYLAEQTKALSLDDLSLDLEYRRLVGLVIYDKEERKRIEMQQKLAAQENMRLLEGVKLKTAPQMLVHQFNQTQHESEGTIFSQQNPVIDCKKLESHEVSELERSQSRRTSKRTNTDHLAWILNSAKQSRNIFLTQDAKIEQSETLPSGIDRSTTQPAASRLFGRVQNFADTGKRQPGQVSSTKSGDKDGGFEYRYLTMRSSRIDGFSNSEQSGDAERVPRFLKMLRGRKPASPKSLDVSIQNPYSKGPEGQTDNIDLDAPTGICVSNSFFQMRAGIAKFMSEKRKVFSKYEKTALSVDHATPKKPRRQVTLKPSVTITPKVVIKKPIMSLLPPKDWRKKPAEQEVLPTPKPSQPKLPEPLPTPLPVPVPKTEVRRSIVKPVSRIPSPSSRSRDSRRVLLSPMQTLKDFPGMNPPIVEQQEDPDNPFQNVTKMLVQMGFIRQGTQQLSTSSSQEKVKRPLIETRDAGSIDGDSSVSSVNKLLLSPKRPDPISLEKRLQAVRRPSEQKPHQKMRVPLRSRLNPNHSNQGATAGQQNTNAPSEGERSQLSQDDPRYAHLPKQVWQILLPNASPI